jgi:hypothetical protein
LFEDERNHREEGRRSSGYKEDGIGLKTEAKLDENARLEFRFPPIQCHGKVGK